VAATIVDRSGCYAHAAFIEDEKRDVPFTSSFAARNQRLGKTWRKLTPTMRGWKTLERTLQREWSNLVNCQEDIHKPVEGPRRVSLRRWAVAALRLMAISDEASEGMGFDLTPEEARDLPLAAYFLFLKVSSLYPSVRSIRGRSLTACLAVPEDECCVLPKSRTPQGGCTTRSLSHHLALLPPVSQVFGRWILFPTEMQGGTRVREARRGPGTAPLNLLLVPFPFRIDGESFVAEDERDEEGWGRFHVRPTWIPTGSRRDVAAKFVSYLTRLIGKAQQEAPVHGVVLPEGALEPGLAMAIASRLRETTALELLVTGAASEPRGTRSAENMALTFLLRTAGRQKPLCVRQNKHHRWRLDKQQIQQYSLGSELDPRSSWWEAFHPGDREVYFCVFRRSWSVTSVVCEDLARIDPVQTVLRSVGPNLVIALLMDGPQLEWRWPARYATVLADDPGSSVLTFTSLGMIRRWRGDEGRGVVGLWKDATGRAQQLTLRPGAHALLITLSPAARLERTLDRRPDMQGAVSLVLTGCQSIDYPGKPPEWTSF